MLLLAGAALVGRELRAKAGSVAVVDRVVIEAEHGGTIIGWRELGQHPGPRAASARHLHVERRDGGWWLANRAPDRQVLVETDRDRSRYLQRWTLATGDRIVLADAAFTVTSADEARLVLGDPESGRAVTWDDGVLVPAGESVHQVCQSRLARWVARARWALRNAAASAERELALFSIGGGLNCSDRWRRPGLSPHALEIVWAAGRFWLAPGTRRADVRLAHATGPEMALGDVAVPVDGADGRVTRVILGRTVYGVEADPSRLTLTPLANMDLWLDAPPAGSHLQLAWAGGGADPVHWLRAQRLRLLPGCIAVVALGVALARYWSTRRHIGGWAIVGRVAGSAPALLGGWLTLLTLHGAPAPDVMVRVGLAWLAWAWASTVLVFRGKLVGLGGWLWSAGVVLAFSGLIVQLQLGAGAENTRWMSFVTKQALLLALAGWSIALLALFPRTAWRAVWLRVFGNELWAVGAGVLLVGVMIGQLAVGTEEGIAGLQPVELSKSVFVVLLAFVGMHVTEIRRRDTRAYRRAPVAFLVPFLRAVAIFGLVVLSLLVGVRDFSPLIILGLVTLAWLWKVGGLPEEAARGWRWWLLRPAVVLVGALPLLAGYVARADPSVLPDGMPQRERVMVWAAPALHPHSGAQVLAAMEAAGDGGWYGRLGDVQWFGRNGEVMDLPAVKDDFAVAFLLHRFGAVAGLVLLGAQLLYVFLLFSLGRRIAARTGAGDFREQSAGLVAGYALYGLAWMQIAHWTIAWGNTLGLLPVMGQPMTWLSVGNSHLLGFGLVTLAVALGTAWAEGSQNPFPGAAASAGNG